MDTSTGPAGEQMPQTAAESGKTRMTIAGSKIVRDHVQIEPCLARRIAFVYSETCRVTGASCGPDGGRERGLGTEQGEAGEHAGPSGRRLEARMRLYRRCPSQLRDVHTVQRPGR